MDPGLKLKRVREKLGLRYRQVEEASKQIAQRHRNSDYILGLSRLADIENKAVIPGLHRFYSLCAIYRLDLAEVLEWYGIDVSRIFEDTLSVEPSNTHLIRIRDGSRGTVQLPIRLEPGVDLSRTTYLSRMIQQWGKIPLGLLDSLDIEENRYGFIGSDDFLMYPLLRPGSLVQIDDSRSKIRNSGWTNEFERPIYFFELRDGYACSFCNVSGDRLILQPHSGSPSEPRVLAYPADVDVIGQVVGVAMHLQAQPVETKIKRRVRSAVSPRAIPSL